MDRFIYIHGWGSSGVGSTAELFRSRIPNLITPSLNYLDPASALETLLDIVDSVDEFDDVYIIASSHGGYFAELVALKRIVNIVVYNPSLDTTNVERLSNKSQPQYRTDAFKLLTNPLSGYSKRSIVLCTDDTVVPPHIAAAYYKDYTITWTDGGHRMTARNADIILTQLNRLVNSI